MNISKRKAGECLNELQDMGLILKRKGGNGYPSRIYVKNFIYEKNIGADMQKLQLCSGREDTDLSDRI